MDDNKQKRNAEKISPLGGQHNSIGKQITNWFSNKTDEIDEKLKKSAENPSWIENTDTYKEIFESKCWDEFGSLTKAWVTTLAFLGEYEIDKRTVQEKMESVVRIAKNSLPELAKNDPESRLIIQQYNTKENDLLNQKNNQLAAYQIGLSLNGLEGKVSLDEVVEFAEKARAERIFKIEEQLNMA